MNESVHDKAQNFIKSNRVCVISILQANGTAHAATVHFSTNEAQTEFYISTKRTTRKVQSLLEGDVKPASMVIGFNEELMVTFQMDGEVQIVLNENELETIKTMHYEMHPFAKRFEGDPETIFLKFKPTWWRYSEFKATPPLFMESK